MSGCWRCAAGVGDIGDERTGIGGDKCALNPVDVDDKCALGSGGVGDECGMTTGDLGAAFSEQTCISVLPGSS